MSVKVMGLIWDLEIGRDEKFILLAYGDHADHDGSNIFPAVATIARKTGYSERQVRRVTHELEERGYLVKVGTGMHGTNQWYIPISGGSIQPKKRDDILSGVTFETDEGGQNVRGGLTFTTQGPDIAMSPESSLNRPLTINESEKSKIHFFPRDIPAQIAWESALVCLKREMPKTTFEKWVIDTRGISYQDGVLEILANDNASRDWLESRLKKTACRILHGILNQDLELRFVLPEEIAHSHKIPIEVPA